ERALGKAGRHLDVAVRTFDPDDVAAVPGRVDDARAVRGDLVQVLVQLHVRLDLAVRQDALDAAAPIRDQDAAVRVRGKAISERGPYPRGEQPGVAFGIDPVQEVLVARMGEDED